MKPFDIEKAKAGQPVCTGRGEPVRILCYDKKGDDYPIVALVGIVNGYEEIETYTLDGCCCMRKKEVDNNLMMATTKKRGWVNIYPKALSDDIGMAQTSERVHNSKRAAELYALTDCIATVPIEWEE